MNLHDSRQYKVMMSIAPGASCVPGEMFNEFLRGLNESRQENVCLSALNVVVRLKRTLGHEGIMGPFA